MSCAITHRLPSKTSNARASRHGRNALLLLLLALSACGNNYQAPVTEQGERLVITPPLIVDSSTPDSALRAQSGRAAVATTASTRGASPVVAGTNTSSTTARTSTINASASVGTSAPRIHRVNRGDTLYSIAFQYDLDFRALALANGLNPPYTIFVNQELNLDVTNAGSAAASSPSSSLGVPVSNNSVARAQGTNTANTGVIRQAIGSVNTTPSWQWPHRGRILRQFDAQGKGIDFEGRVGEPVYAASAGDVVYSGRGIQGAGELIILRHSDRYLSAYSHNSAMLVKEGDRVQAGQQIAEVGTNPAGTPLLHFEIRVDGKSVDPAELLPRR